ncbi:inversin-like [Leptodactylus fuscus]|uniref:inversin-like n=1 Tax=Leptodactylus fuscus TaxID=238119 RepID=UPI003F4E99BC
MLNILRFRKEKALRDKVLDTIKTNKPEDLRLLLSKDKVKKLIRKTGGKVLSRSLISAIHNKHLECMEELLKAGAYPGVVDNRNLVARAVNMRKGRFLKLLLEYGANPDCGEDLPLYTSARMAELGIFRTLLLYGADPDYNGSDQEFLRKYLNSQSVLGWCLASNCDVQFVQLLVQFGANMYVPDIQEILLQADNDAARYLSRERGTDNLYF